MYSGIVGVEFAMPPPSTLCVRYISDPAVRLKPACELRLDLEPPEPGPAVAKPPFFAPSAL
jgi:hypothetical protein